MAQGFEWVLTGLPRYGITESVAAVWTDEVMMGWRESW